MQEYLGLTLEWIAYCLLRTEAVLHPVRRKSSFLYLLALSPACMWNMPWNVMPLHFLDEATVFCAFKMIWNSHSMQCRTKRNQRWQMSYHKTVGYWHFMPSSGKFFFLPTPTKTITFNHSSTENLACCIVGFALQISHLGKWPNLKSGPELQLLNRLTPMHHVFTAPLLSPSSFVHSFQLLLVHTILTGILPFFVNLFSCPTITILIGYQCENLLGQKSGSGYTWSTVTLNVQCKTNTAMT